MAGLMAVSFGAAGSTVWAGPPGCPEAGSAGRRPQGRCAPRKGAVASRKGEAILDRDGPRCLEIFRPGRENGTPAEPENGDWEGGR